MAEKELFLRIFETGAPLARSFKVSVHKVTNKADGAEVKPREEFQEGEFLYHTSPDDSGIETGPCHIMLTEKEVPDQIVWDLLQKLGREIAESN